MYTVFYFAIKKVFHLFSMGISPQNLLTLYIMKQIAELALLHRCTTTKTRTDWIHVASFIKMIYHILHSISTKNNTLLSLQPNNYIYTVI